MRRVLTLVGGQRSPSMLPIVLITATLLGIGVWAAQENFLPCIADCGETFISQFYVRNYRWFGLEHGMIEDHATSPDPSAHPYYYTHNVNIGGLSFVLLEMLGFRPFWAKQLVILLVFGAGLFYLYRCATYHSRSPLLGLSALMLACSDYAFFLRFGMHALRAWSWLAMFGLLFHVGRLARAPEDGRRANVIAILLLASIAFGVGYEFWLCCVFISLFALVFCRASPGSSRQFLVTLVVLTAALGAPFVLRQAHIIAVMGWDFWVRDFYFTVVIKVPLVNAILPFPSVAEVESFYASNHILRPPTWPLRWHEVKIFLGDAGNSWRVIIPAAGLVGSTAAGLVCGGSILWLTGRELHRLRNWLGGRGPMVSSDLVAGVDLLGTARMMAALTLGILVGSAVTLQVIVPIYLHIGFPLIGGLFALAKGLLLAVAIGAARPALGRRSRARTFGALVIALFVIIDHAVVQVDNARASLPMETSWISAVAARPHATFAVSYIAPSVAAFTQNWAVGIAPYAETKVLGRLREGKPPFQRNDFLWFGERDAEEKDWVYLQPDYWLYFVVDRKVPYYDPLPECRQDYLTKLLSLLRRPSSLPTIGRSWSEPASVRAGGAPMVFTVEFLNGADVVSVELAIEDVVVGQAPMNCLTAQAVVESSIPEHIAPGRHVPELRLTRSDGSTTKIRAGEIVVDPAAPLVPSVRSPRRQPTVAEVLQNNPRLNVAESDPLRPPWRGYILIDLRNSYRHR